MHVCSVPTEASLKAQAQRLKTFLAAKGQPLPHTSCLEAVAVQYGHKSWQHLRAALTGTSPTLPLETQGPVTEQAVTQGLFEMMRAHLPTLSRMARYLVSERAVPIPFEETRVDNQRSEGTTRWLYCGVRVAVDSDTTLTLKLSTELTNDFGVLNVDVGLCGVIFRPGHGPEDWKGCSVGQVDQGGSADLERCRVAVHEDWRGQLAAFFKDMSINDAQVLEALDALPGESLADVRAELSTRIEGMTAEELNLG